MYICILSDFWYFRNQYRAEFPGAVIVTGEIKMILMSGNNLKLDNISLIAGIIIVGIMGILFITLLIMLVVSYSSYMDTQKKTGADKQKVMDIMQLFMGKQYSNYQYIVGHYTKKEENKFGEAICYLYPYILAFSDTELIIFSFLVRDGKLIIRNRLDVNWQETGMHYFVSRTKTVFLYLYIEGDCMQINIPRVVNSSGVEKSDTPLGIYQEQEAYRFISLLPLYKSYCKIPVKQ